eukprot:1185351-Prorocentrum_minimum.AAC.2
MAKLSQQRQFSMPTVSSSRELEAERGKLRSGTSSGCFSLFAGSSASSFSSWSLARERKGHFRLEQAPPIVCNHPPSRWCHYAQKRESCSALYGIVATTAEGRTAGEEISARTSNLHNA